MGLRVKLRKTFGSSSKKSNSTSSATNTNNNSASSSIYPNEQHYTDRTDIEYYKPNEIPKSKYRGKVDPAHQASLGAFSLSDAFAATTRRASLALSGTFSPGGTKSQSRVPSRVPSRRPSVTEGLPGSHLRTEDRAGSESDVSRERSEDSNTSSNSGAVGGQSSDTASTSLSGPTSTTGTTAPTTAVAPTPLTTLTSPSHPKLVAVQNDGAVDITLPVLSKQITAHDTPFTAEELEIAMTRATFRDREGVVHEVHVS